MKFELKFLAEAFITGQHKLIYELYFKPKGLDPTLFTQGTLQYIREYVLNHCKNAITVAQMIELNHLITEEENKDEEIKRALSGITGIDNETVFEGFDEGKTVVEIYELDGFRSLHLDFTPPHPHRKMGDYVKFL